LKEFTLFKEREKKARSSHQGVSISGALS